MNPERRGGHNAKRGRNAELYRRFWRDLESVPSLARHYGISRRRVVQILQAARGRP